jgi:gluconate 2-dehydrogenase subunit 3-like protein
MDKSNSKHNLWSRRKFGKAAIAAKILIASGFYTLPVSCSPSEELAEGEFLEASLKEVLENAMDEIIPASSTMPSASSIGGLHYVLDVLTHFPELAPPLRVILKELEKSAKGNFLDMNSEQKTEILTQLDTSHPHSFSILKNFAYEGYYTNEAVWEKIGYQPYPTLGIGPDMEAFNESLLNRVKKSKPIFKKI